MSKISFENYGQRALECTESAVAAGRYLSQSVAEKFILPDIVQKLELNTADSVLDIGCGAGNLTIPLSFWVRDITGIDHPSCIARFRRRFSDNSVKLITGSFMETQIASMFDKILCYSVLHYLSSEAEVIAFVDKALGLLKPGGKALFGDIPNSLKKKRFLASAFGQQFDREWRLEQQEFNEPNPIQLPSDPEVVQFDDDMILRIVGRFRRQNFNCYLLPQSPSLPMGYTREDLLIVYVG
jgi:SAM-dependent methyltransferase